MAWFKKTRKPIRADNASRVPEGLWVKCPGCGQVIYNKDLADNMQVCPKCAHHFRMSARERLALLFDGEFTIHDAGLRSTDPLGFTDTKPYKKRLESSIKSSGLNDAIVSATGTLDGIPTVIAAMEYAFIGGSMGVVVGETLTRAIERGFLRRISGDAINFVNAPSALERLGVRAEVVKSTDDSGYTDLMSPGSGDLVRRIKQALDPGGRMNPGVLGL